MHYPELYCINLSINYYLTINSLHQVMSQIASVRWQNSEKFGCASNFTIWASVSHLKDVQYGGVVQGFIKSGALLCADIDTEKVKVALDTICHTLVTGGVPSRRVRGGPLQWLVWS